MVYGDEGVSIFSCFEKHYLLSPSEVTTYELPKGE